MSVSPDSREMDKSKSYIKTLSVEEAGTPDSAQEILGYLGWESWAIGNRAHWTENMTGWGFTLMGPSMHALWRLGPRSLPFGGPHLLQS